ncbi:lipoprotein [Paraburkholderia caffeinilytica]|uniref:Lipoprotein n=1 Tax=Paraburkholderia caffeinilytica TaxID=1761016 RepID=A0ABQ1LR45_9BURK|nr:BON domain-containing protein [Paraburkholderia caffeinilytica]AXL53691.1 lipoprotein [Paraburkholderia caffeinilytica]GGC26924.1 lipoprotein [Paraburkholderia caffeinilytica]CAB3779923.1 hypothetical protein LMG28690_00841 [Paraburkholderia caffeinilytica]
MKRIHGFGIAIFMTIVTAPCAVFAQGSAGMVAQASSSLVLAPTAKEIRKANHQLENKIRSALDKAKISPVNLAVIAKNGAVTLLGEVASATEVTRAGDVARSVAGVSSVNNKLSVSNEYR